MTFNNSCRASREKQLIGSSHSQQILAPCMCTYCICSYIFMFINNSVTFKCRTIPYYICRIFKKVIGCEILSRNACASWKSSWREWEVRVCIRTRTRNLRWNCALPQSKFKIKTKAQSENLSPSHVTCQGERGGERHLLGTAGIENAKCQTSGFSVHPAYFHFYFPHRHTDFWNAYTWRCQRTDTCVFCGDMMQKWPNADTSVGGKPCLLTKTMKNNSA